MGKNKGGKGGVVVNIASIAGLAPFATIPLYSATKHAVIGLTRSFGVSTAIEKSGIPYNITVGFQALVGFQSF
jgi:15-hydroxyprostaglandin dehydrogenase (NAD)